MPTPTPIFSVLISPTTSVSLNQLGLTGKFLRSLEQSRYVAPCPSLIGNNSQIPNNFVSVVIADQGFSPAPEDGALLIFVLVSSPMELMPELEIPFPFPDPLIEEGMGSQMEAWERATQREAFWLDQSTQDWFKEKGYILYKKASQSEEEPPLPQLPDDDFVAGEYPYAFHSNFSMNGTFKRPPREPVGFYPGTIHYAQDTRGRHIVFKLVTEGTDELRIYEMLYKESHQTLRENCVIPVLDILSIKGYRFVAIPRWGDHVTGPAFRTLREVTDLVAALLKALAFLHGRRIVHRDMGLGNTVVNYFSSTHCHGRDYGRAQYREAGQLLYAVIDFDLSKVAPDDGLPFRLPYFIAYQGKMPFPHDISQGEFDFDPFPFDVASLGAHLCGAFQHLCDQIPFFAPLFDKMTTRDIPRRFTAQEALKFFQVCMDELPAETLLQRPEEKDLELWNYSFDECDRWKLLAPEAQARWAAYREPPVPQSIVFLRWICSFHYPSVIIRMLNRAVTFTCRLWYTPSRQST